jgi:ankyrin repeat protein
LARARDHTYIAKFFRDNVEIHTRQPQAVLKLLERGASLEGSAGHDALFMASGYGDAETVSMLLSYGVPLPQDAPSAARGISTTAGPGATGTRLSPNYSSRKTRT